MIQQTSIDSYYTLEHLPEKRKIVYDAIVNMKTACNLDIAYYLKLPINRITPRTNELVKLGLVEFSHKDICTRTGKTVMYWKAK